MSALPPPPSWWVAAKEVQESLDEANKAAKMKLLLAKLRLWGALSFLDNCKDEDMPTLIKRIAKEYSLSPRDQFLFYKEIERRTEKADKMKAFLDSSVSEREKVLYLERVEREELEIEARVTGKPLSSKAMGVVFIPSTSTSYKPYTPPPVSTKSSEGRKCPTCGGLHVAAYCPKLKGTELSTAAAPAASATPAAFRAAVAAATSADVWQTVKGGKVIVAAAAPRIAAAAPRVAAAAPRPPAAAVGGAGAPPTEWKTVTKRC